MAKVTESAPVFNEAGRRHWVFHCPGCKCDHAFYEKMNDGRPGWRFNGDLNNPTFEPSLLVRWGDKEGDKRCHLFLRNGRLEFLSDCTHALAGTTVDLPDVD